MGQKTTLDSRSTAETQAFFKLLAQKLKPGDVVGMVGELGAGKTTAVQAILAAFGLSGGESPTFVMVRPYELASPKRGITRIIHVDAYRFDRPDEALTTGIVDVIDDPKALILVEWADRIRSLLPAKTIWVNLVHRGADQRRIEVKQ